MKLLVTGQSLARNYSWLKAKKPAMKWRLSPWIARIIHRFLPRGREATVICRCAIWRQRLITAMKRLANLAAWIACVRWLKTIAMCFAVRIKLRMRSIICYPLHGNCMALLIWSCESGWVIVIILMHIWVNAHYGILRKISWNRQSKRSVWITLSRKERLLFMGQKSTLWRLMRLVVNTKLQLSS